MITISKAPSNWKELQDKVCKLLNEAGYNSESPKTIKTVRGDVEVDVYSESEDELVKHFICECKYWNTPIPKEKIHAFRTVVNDSGSTIGIIISKNGFQSGAYDAACCSNVLLKDWDGFLDLIKRKWFKHRIIKIKNLLAPLSVYMDPLDVPLDSLSNSLKERYDNLTINTFKIYMFCRSLNFGSISSLNDEIVVNENTFNAFDELFDYLEKNLIMAIIEYENIFKHTPVDEDNLNFSHHLLYDFSDLSDLL